MLAPQKRRFFDFDSQVRRMGEIQAELLRSYTLVEGWVPPTLTNTEEIWHRFEYLTRKYWWCSLTLDQLINHEFVRFPGWEALGE